MVANRDTQVAFTRFFIDSINQLFIHFNTYEPSFKAKQAKRILRMVLSNLNTHRVRLI